MRPTTGAVDGSGVVRSARKRAGAACLGRPTLLARCHVLLQAVRPPGRPRVDAHAAATGLSTVEPIFSTTGRQDTFSWAATGCDQPTSGVC
jgi:hypothetical protein